MEKEVGRVPAAPGSREPSPDGLGHAATVPNADMFENLAYEAMRFFVWAAGQGICPIDGEPAVEPEEALYAYAVATGEQDYDRLPAQVLASFEKPQWLPIGTAPKDGSTIIGCGLNHGVGPAYHLALVYWDEDRHTPGFYDRGESDSAYVYLTSWCHAGIPSGLASAMSAGTAETAQQAQGEARQRDGTEECRDAQGPSS